MTCFDPNPAYQQITPNSNGKRPISFNGYPGYKPVMLPCGQCRGCKLERARQWSMRCVHEAQMYGDGHDNAFLTLTFNDESLLKRPNPWSLNKKELQDFWKRLRKHETGINEVINTRIKDGIEEEYQHKPIRYYAAGEYGGKCRACGIQESFHSRDGCANFWPGRPHYHALTFNWRPSDLEPYSAHGPNVYYTSKKLNQYWGHGNVIVGNVTFESAGYIARYCLKKRNGEQAFDRYHQFDIETGEWQQLLPEFSTQSTRGGIGRSWFDRYLSDVYPHDFVVVRGKKMRPPKYYDRLLESQDPLLIAMLKEQREEKAALRSIDQTDARLKTREEFLRIITDKSLPRNFDGAN